MSISNGYSVQSVPLSLKHNDVPAMTENETVGTQQPTLREQPQHSDFTEQKGVQEKRSINNGYLAQSVPLTLKHNDAPAITENESVGTQQPTFISSKSTQNVTNGDTKVNTALADSTSQNMPTNNTVIQAGSLINDENLSLFII